jgi:hypothetical protein
MEVEKTSTRAAEMASPSTTTMVEVEDPETEAREAEIEHMSALRDALPPARVSAQGAPLEGPGPPPAVALTVPLCVWQAAGATGASRAPCSAASGAATRLRRRHILGRFPALGSVLAGRFSARARAWGGPMQRFWGHSMRSPSALHDEHMFCVRLCLLCVPIGPFVRDLRVL